MERTDLNDINILRKFVKYDPETGKLYWVPRSHDLFKEGQKTALHQANVWNAKYAGNEIVNKCNGYISCMINGKKLYAHRIAYALYHNNWPVNEVDHINRNRIDNRIVNLREATKSQQTMNTNRQNKNSGCLGVYWSSSNKKWCATIQVNGKKYHLGFHKNLDDAIVARKNAEIKYHGNYRSFK